MIQNCRIIPVVLIFLFSCGQRSSRLQAITDQEGIAITEDSSRVLFYQVKPKSLNGKYERSSYIHPLYSLKGNVITEDFPEDHPHHHGIYSAWHQILLDNRSIGDGWTGDNISVSVVDTRVTDQPESIAIHSEVLWSAALGDRQAEPVVKERLQIIAHESNEQFRVVDYNFILFPLKDSLSIGGSADEKGYGGFSLRFKLPGDIRFIAKGEEVEAQVVSVDAGPWMNFAGSFDGVGGGQSGVIVFNHPSNPGSPQPWILRKEKSMQNPAFPGKHPVMLSKEGLSLRYRMIIHNGDLDENAIDALYREYTDL